MNPPKSKLKRDTAFKRYENLKKIHFENQALLDRLTHTRSFYEKKD